jgi:PEGA domain
MSSAGSARLARLVRVLRPLFCAAATWLLLAALASGAAAQRVIALAPLATMGSEDTSAAAQATAAQLERAIAALPATKVLSPVQLSAAVKRAKRPGLATCDGELGCVAELGLLAGAAVVVTGQSGGLGEARVIYLRAVDTTSRKELGSTTWTAGPGDSAAAAVARLLNPAGYTGKLALASAVKDATVYVNGRKLGASSVAAFSLPVGTHALRVTHPEYRDFVRFVDVAYDTTTPVEVVLQPLSIVQRDLVARGGGPSTTGPASSPWYREWWAVAGGATALAVIAGVIAYSATDGFSPDVTLPND